MRWLSRMWIIITGILFVMAACSPQAPLPTLAPTPVPPTETPSPTVTRTPTLTPTATQAVPQTESTNPALQSFIRAVNISQIAEPIDVYIDSLNIAVFLEYGQFTSPGGIVAGDYTLHIVPAGGRPGDGSLIQQPITIGGQQSLIVLFSGTLTAPQVRIITEDTSPLGANESRLSVINAVIDGPTFTLQLDETDTPLTPALAPGDISPAIVLSTGETPLVLLTGETILRTFTSRFRERQNYIFIVVGQGNNRESLLVLNINTPVSGLAQVRAIHAAFGAEAVDIYAGAVQLGDAMIFGNDRARQTLVSGIYDIAVFPAGADPTTSESLVTQQIALNPDDVFAFIFIGEMGTYEIIPFQETLSLTPLDAARITFMHVMPSVPTIQLEAADMPPLTIRYGQLSDTFLMPAQPTTFSWAVPERSGTGEVLEFADGVSLQPGINYLYLFTGRRLDLPLIYQETVGAVIPTPDPNDFTPTPTQIPTTTLRLINAIPGAFVDFRVDDINIISALPYQESSTPIIVTDGDRIVTAHDQATGQLLARTIVTVNAGVHYSVFVSPASGISYNMTVTDDVLPPPTLTNAPFLRLVNTSSVDSLFGLAYSDHTPGADIEPVVDPNAAPPEDGGLVDDPYRRSLPFGTVRLINDISVTTASEFFPAVRIAGDKDVVIIDMYQTMVAATLVNVTLEENTYYDVVAFQQEGSTRVTAFIVAYPPLP